MKRAGFKAKGWAPRPVKTIEYEPRPREVARSVTPSGLALQLPKDSPVRHEGYRRLVASMPCIGCGLEGSSQAAHGPSLGRGIKADDRTCVPLCADSATKAGCHTKADKYISFGRSERADRFALWGRETRQKILRDGLWPADLERWQEK